MKDSTLGLLLNIRETKLRIKLRAKLQFELGGSEVIVFSRAIYHRGPEGRNTTDSQRRDSSYRHAFSRKKYRSGLPLLCNSQDREGRRDVLPGIAPVP
ncbi:hypothetical protein E2C01_057280 [Portunus trituberculatus]|uniref:Uncharacterized protein n=1 Tax=Portunus trituberculatus TaxID=210409 RepID=A0A5B7H027_PORTR|nr:hypothetical protein [Portunus trituberculatus]